MLRCNSKNSFRGLAVVEGEQLVGLHSSFFEYSFLLTLSVLCPAKDKAWLELPGYTLVEDAMVSVARRNTRNGFLKSVSWVLNFYSVQFSSVVQSCLSLCDPMSTAHQSSLCITNSWSPPKPMSMESVMPSSHLILCHPLLLLPRIPPSIRVFSNESTLHMRWPKYWSFSLSHQHH